MKKITIKTVRNLGLALLIPVFAFGADKFRPADVHIITLENTVGDKYEVSLQLKEGNLHTFKEVIYRDSRYRLFEDIAKMINDDRRFTGFDDDDIVDLIFGDFPFVKNDIDGATAVFTEELVIVNLYYKTGDNIIITQNPERRFTNPNEAADFIRNLINEEDAFEGSFNREEIYDLVKTFEGVEYYAPEVSRIEAQYDEEDQVIDVIVYFENGETREFETAFKENKQKITEDIAILISDLYSEREEGVLLRSDITEKIQWVNLPRLIDDIELILVNIKQEGVVYIEVRTILANGALAFTLFEAPFASTLDDEEALSIVVADTLEASPEFSPDFDLNDLSSRIQTGDIDFNRYEVSATSSEPIAEQADIDDNDFIVNEQGHENTTLADQIVVRGPDDISRVNVFGVTLAIYNENTGQATVIPVAYQANESDSLGQVYTRIADMINNDNRYSGFSANDIEDLYQGDLPPHQPSLTTQEQDQYLLLLQLIILYIQENDLDVDISVLQ